MSNYIETNSDGVIYIQNEDGVIFGIVDATTLISEDGIKYENAALEILSCKEFEIEEDFELEQTIVTLGNAKIIFCNDSVEVDIY